MLAELTRQLDTGRVEVCDLPAITAEFAVASRPSTGTCSSSDGVELGRKPGEDGVAVGPPTGHLAGRVHWECAVPGHGGSMSGDRCVRWGFLYRNSLKSHRAPVRRSAPYAGLGT